MKNLKKLLKNLEFLVVQDIYEDTETATTIVIYYLPSVPMD